MQCNAIQYNYLLVLPIGFFETDLQCKNRSYLSNQSIIQLDKMQPNLQLIKWNHEYM